MAPRAEALYSPRLLALAVELADYPLDASPAATGRARSRTCGSTLVLSSADSERISRVGLAVTACAVGQAAAAIFASAAQGLGPDDLTRHSAAIEAWLEEGRSPPDWPRLDLLAAAQPHRGRHEAILLPWRAALDALCKPADAR